LVTHHKRFGRWQGLGRPLRSEQLLPSPPQPSATRSTLWTGPPPAEILWRCWTSLATTTSRRPCTASRSPAPSGIPTGRSSGSSGSSTRTSAKVGALLVPRKGPRGHPMGAGSWVCFWRSRESAQPASGLRPISAFDLHPALAPLEAGRRTPVGCSRRQSGPERQINTHIPGEMKDGCANPTKPSCLILDLTVICL